MSIILCAVGVFLVLAWAYHLGKKDEKVVVPILEYTFKIDPNVEEGPFKVTVESVRAAMVEFSSAMTTTGQAFVAASDSIKGLMAALEKDESLSATTGMPVYTSEYVPEGTAYLMATDLLDGRK